MPRSGAILTWTAALFCTAPFFEDLSTFSYVIFHDIAEMQKGDLIPVEQIGQIFGFLQIRRNVCNTVYHLLIAISCN